ncbi:MAG: hypothetical protein JJE04_13540 [Acidobacteriia bacterium]|nr:hypothetical protein [Terriglobia bacterium]
MRAFSRVAIVAMGCWFATGWAWGDSLIPPLTEKQTAEARKILASFKSNPRGPFERIRWFCNDGAVLPPEGTPCRARGGGYQHGELSANALKLMSWNLHTGTILAGLPFEVLIDEPLDHHWLKELVLEKYLVAVDRDWVYRKAISYRGARQVEDEEKAGRKFLIQLFSNPKWLAANYHLAGQLADSLPHGVAGSKVKRIRSLATIAAERDPRFQGTRVKIHSYPGPEDLTAVRDFLTDGNPSEAARNNLEELAGLLQEQYSRQSWVPALRAAQKSAAGTPVHARIEELVGILEAKETDQTPRKLSDLSLGIRRQIVQSDNGRQNLDLLDLSRILEQKSFELRRPAPEQPRRDLLEDLRSHFRLAAGGGLMSLRQLEALEAELDSLSQLAPVPAEQYRASLRYLGRASEWCRATVAMDFGPVSRHYQSVEPAAAGLVDHLVRGSAALELTNRLETLLGDADRTVGIRHSILGSLSSGGVVGLNPGISTGRLGIIHSDHEMKNANPGGIYAIPETISELKPMAGILTVDSGNALSHAQLLAANLGIPNARIPSSLLPDLEKRSGLEMFYAVTPRGVVVLKEKSALSGEEKRLWAAQPVTRQRLNLDTGRLRLDDKRLRLLVDLNTKDAGVIVGPKAANLGQLASYFPREVATGVVIPFGVFHEHVSRVLDDSGMPLIQQIGVAVSHVEKLRDSGAAPAAINTYMYPRLAHFRRLIQTMPLLDGFERELMQKMEKNLGPDGSYGVFVRSDTNAEDLPGFTGAGLNLTVANQVGRRNILQSVKDVWASPFTERAFDWRSRALKGTDKVYPSVIVMRAVPSDKSGVIATVDLENGSHDYITVNASEGVSAVVDGGVAESILLGPNGSVQLLQQCRATYRKALRKEGGFENLPAFGKDYLLTPGDIVKLREMVAEVKRRYPAAQSAAGTVLPWDIEFGFEQGDLRLFQIRPLARFQELETLNALTKLEGPIPAVKLVRLNERPLR